MSIDLSKSVVMKDGLADLEATLKNVAEEIANYNVAKQNDVEVIGVAVHAVFDQWKGASIDKPSLISFTLAKLSGVDALNHKTFVPRAHEVIDAMTATGVLSMRKGRNGGYSRCADQPVKA
jgi:hypothetical protein